MAKIEVLYSNLLLNYNLYFCITSIVLYLVYQVGMIYIICKLRKILSFVNYVYLFFFAITLLVKAAEICYLYAIVGDYGHRRMSFEN